MSFMGKIKVICEAEGWASGIAKREVSPGEAVLVLFEEDGAKMYMVDSEVAANLGKELVAQTDPRAAEPTEE